jgi:beta-ureidopropionase / N-carbamoyl-L-amino-acid hydrolase
MVGFGKTGLDPDRIRTDIEALASITDPERRYTRRSFSPLFMQGRAWLQQRFAEAGLATQIDAAGNLIGRREGSLPAAGSIVVGSHSDTVPAGGRFDGVAGLVAALEIARVLGERGIRLRHAFDVVDFLAEEPSEYGLSCIGSRGMSGALTAQHLAMRNASGETLGAALAHVGGEPARLAEARRFDIRAAFELHIEQGRVLETDRISIGVVSSIVGITRIEVAFRGSPDHAGTAPMDRRRDALVAAARVVGAVRTKAEEIAGRGADYFVATTGVLELQPGAANVVPGSARLIIDARSEQRPQMDEFIAWLEAETVSAAIAAGVEHTSFKRLSDTLPAACDGHLRTLLKEGAAALGLRACDIASGAGHDAAFLSLIAPSAMVFIPCREGRSHCPEEWAEPEAVAAGAAVMLQAMLRFDEASV